MLEKLSRLIIALITRDLPRQRLCQQTGANSECPYYSRGGLFVKQNAHQQRLASAKVIVVMHSRASYNVALQG